MPTNVDRTGMASLAALRVAIFPLSRKTRRRGNGEGRKSIPRGARVCECIWKETYITLKRLVSPLKYFFERQSNVSSVLMGGGIGGGGGGRSPAIFSTLNTMPIGVAWKE